MSDIVKKARRLFMGAAILCVVTVLVASLGLIAWFTPIPGLTGALQSATTTAQSQPQTLTSSQATSVVSTSTPAATVPPAPKTVTIDIPKGSGFPAGTAGSSAPNWYMPDKVTVVMGVNNTIKWINKDDVPHTVTDEKKAFDSGIMNAGDGYTHTFAAPGTYLYHCTLHPWMRGTVIVKSGSKPS